MTNSFSFENKLLISNYKLLFPLKNNTMHGKSPTKTKYLTFIINFLKADLFYYCAR